MITQVEHFCFAVSNLEKALDFFCDVLGLERPDLINEFEGEPVATMIGCSGVHARGTFVEVPGSSSIELVEYLNPKGAQVDSSAWNPGSSHISFVVNDLDRMYEELSEKGVKFLSPPQWVRGADGKGRLGRWGCCFLKGPDQITVELFEMIID